ncbi:hypothetical protein YC2023_055781 [Brassica napus]
MARHESLRHLISSPFPLILLTKMLDHLLCLFGYHDLFKLRSKQVYRWEANEYSLKLIQMMKLTLADSMSSMMYPFLWYFLLLGMGLIRFWTVQGSGDIVDKDSKKCVSTCSRKGRGKASTVEDMSREDQKEPKEGTYDLVATRDISLQNKFHTEGMESIEITTLEDENEIKIVLAESKERKPARKWWSY